MFAGGATLQSLLLQLLKLNQLSLGERSNSVAVVSQPQLVLLHECHLLKSTYS